MMVLRRVLRYWDTILAVIAASAAASWLSTEVIKAITPELIAFFTIQSAVILPAMIFTAGLLRGDGLTIEEIDRYQGALRKQMVFWVTLLFLDLIAVAFLVLGKAVDWKWKITIIGHSGEFGWILVWITAALSALAIFRMIPFVQGVMSQLELNATLAKMAIKAREREKEAPEPPPSTFDRPKGFGRILPSKRRAS
jgi:hypothetical protein